MLVPMNSKINIKEINYGIQLLRMILCLWVLSFHCLDKNKINYFLFFITKTKFYHVPCFALLSFYFSSTIFLDKNIIKFKRRLERLLIPYFIWPLLIFIINNIFYKKKISLHQLKIQILLGRQFMVPFWYLFSVTFLTTSFFILSNIFKMNFFLLIKLLMVFSYIFQYSSCDKFLDEYNHSVKLPILDTIRILPLSITGILLESSKLIEFFKKNKNNYLFFSFLLLFLLFKFDIFIELGGYNGIINIFSSLLFFIGFYLLPFENINSFIQKIIKQITSYTNGIYCLHLIIKSFFFRDKSSLEGTFKSCIIIYLISYLISFIGMKIFWNNKLKYLFL